MSGDLLYNHGKAVEIITNRNGKFELNEETLRNILINPLLLKNQ